nr:hypothetical protein CFP56_63380 [Quercus suber]POE94776.1 hypothetical protein CFP56_17013 [Quercus suber]
MHLVWRSSGNSGVIEHWKSGEYLEVYITAPSSGGCECSLCDPPSASTKFKSTTVVSRLQKEPTSEITLHWDRKCRSVKSSLDFNAHCVMDVLGAKQVAAMCIKRICVSIHLVVTDSADYSSSRP